MDNKKLQVYAEEIKKLEQECQKGINIKENIKKMDKIFSSLSLVDMLKLADYIEQDENFI